MDINFDKVKCIIDYFDGKPLIRTELKYRNDYELLISVILSAQCTDKRINEISPDLFKVYSSFKELSSANFNDVFELIKSVSYPVEKTKRIIEVSNIIHNEYNDIIPNNFEKLLKINGIGRKTANLVLSILYGYEGIAVDTHVARVSNRLGLVNSKNANIIERELSYLFPRKYYNKINPWFVIFGRYQCKAIGPKCSNCGLKKICKNFE